MWELVGPIQFAGMVFFDEDHITYTPYTYKQAITRLECSLCATCIKYAPHHHVCKSKSVYSLSQESTAFSLL